jgi:hypothetical protein
VALQGDEQPERLNSIGRLSLAKRGFQIVRIPMPSDMEAGSGLPDDTVPVKIPQANGDTLVDAIEFYADIDQNSVAQAQVGHTMWDSSGWHGTQCRPGGTGRVAQAQVGQAVWDMK